MMQQNTANLNELIARVERHQHALGLNDTQFVTRYQKYLGSAKTWRDRLCKRDYAALGKGFPRWERKLNMLVGELDGTALPSVFYQNMPFAKYMSDMYQRLAGQKNDRRCGVCLAVTGSGKSAWAQYMKSQHPRDIVYVRANESWRENTSEISRALAETVGCEVTPFTSSSLALRLATDRLKQNPVTMVIDEAHKGGLMLMKVVQTLIDGTLAKFILMAYPTAWRKMMAASDDSRAEAQQLFGRCIKPIFADYVHGVSKEDITVYLQEAAGMNGEADGAAAHILSMVRSNGNLRLLADATDLALMQAEVTEEPLDGQAIIDRVQELCPVIHAKEGRNNGK